MTAPASTAASVSVLAGFAPTRALARLATRLAGDVMFRKSVLSIADQAVVSATNFAITVVLGRLCGKPELGLYYLALQIVFFARGVQEQLISSPYLVYAARREGRAAAIYAGSSLVHELALLCAVSLLLACASICGFASPALADVLGLLAIAAPLLLLREYVRQIAFADLRVEEALTLDTAVCGLQVVGLLAAAACGVLTTQLTYAILAIGCGLAVLAWLLRRGGTFVLQRQAIAADWHHNWQFGRWALASQLLGSSMPFVLPWIVAGTHGEAATSTLGVGTTLIGFANMFVLGLSNFICPRAAQSYAQGGPRELVSVLQQAALMYLGVLLPFALLMIVAGPWLMALVYGPEFADAGVIMAVLACGAVANSLGITAGNGLWAMERPSANFRADVCALITWLVATALLVPAYGALGAAVASVTGTVVGAAVRGGVLLAELSRRPEPA
jgi:O-antigen/teichoic acid export membrane protein